MMRFKEFFQQYILESIDLDEEYLRLAQNSGYIKKLYTAQTPGSLNNFNFDRVGQNERGLAALGPGVYLLDNKKSTEYNYGKRGTVFDVLLSKDAFIIDIFSRDKDHWKSVKEKLDKVAVEAGYESYKSMPDKNVSGLNDGRGPVGIFSKLLGRKKTRELFVKHGIHGSREELPSGSFEYAIYDPSKIKSADPVTYDDDGNIIPLSKRFDKSKDDIRY